MPIAFTGPGQQQKVDCDAVVLPCKSANSSSGHLISCRGLGSPCWANGMRATLQVSRGGSVGVRPRGRLVEGRALESRICLLWVCCKPSSILYRFGAIKHTE